MSAVAAGLHKRAMNIDRDYVMVQACTHSQQSMLKSRHRPDPIAQSIVTRCSAVAADQLAGVKCCISWPWLCYKLQATG
jgi:hypothetical protein